jgi:hypothetical protein
MKNEMGIEALENNEQICWVNKEKGVLKLQRKIK